MDEYGLSRELRTGERTERLWPEIVFKEIVWKGDLAQHDKSLGNTHGQNKDVIDTRYPYKQGEEGGKMKTTKLLAKERKLSQPL